MDLMAKGSRWLGLKQKAYAAQEVHLLRGESTVSVSAVVGRSSFEQTDSDGLVTSIAPRDFIVLAADYLVDDEAAEPAPGDRIVQGGLDGGYVYEVVSEPGVPLWAWSDEDHTKYRVHTKYVGRSPLVDEVFPPEEEED